MLTLATMLTPHDIDLIERDRRLPRLRDLLDPERYEALIRENAPEDGVTGVSLTYLRYKPGMNCLAGYEYRTDDRIRFAYAKIYTEEQREKREKLQLRAGGNDDIALAFFPHDGKLRSLKKLDGGAVERKFIERIFSKRPDLWDGDIVPIRYKPERRFVARLVLYGENRAVVKIHTGNSYARLRNFNKAFASRGNLRLARRVGHSDRHRVLAFEWLPGRLLSDLIREGIIEPDLLRPVGEALAHIHEQTTDHLPVRGPDVDIHHLDAVARQIAFLCPDLAGLTMRTVRSIAALLAGESPSFAATHGDFYAKQVLLDSDRIGVLDFDESALADPMADIGNFVAHLERDRLRFDLAPDVLDACQEALLTGYAGTGRPVDERRIDLYHAACLFKLLPHPFRFREPDWPEQTRQLLERVRTLLDDAGSGSRRIGTSIPASRNNVHRPESIAFVDAAMPYLGRALDRDAAFPLLERRMKERFPGHTLCDIRRIRLRRHKPGRRCLIEYDLQLESPAGKRMAYPVLGKIRAKKLDRATYDLTRALWNDAFNSHSTDGLYVPEPLGVVPEFNMWLQRKIDGYTTTGYLDDPIGALLARDVARALHKLNTFGPPPQRTHTIADELAILDDRLPQVADQYPAWVARIADVLAACHELAGRLPRTAPLPVHRDFYPDNLLIASNGVYLLDLDLYSLGDPALDAGNFIGHILEYSLRRYRDPHMLMASAQAFEDTFVDLAGEHTRPAIDVYTTLTLARHIQISTLFPERRPFTEAILALCEERLARHRSGEPV